MGLVVPEVQVEKAGLGVLEDQENQMDLVNPAVLAAPVDLKDLVGQEVLKDLSCLVAQEAQMALVDRADRVDQMVQVFPHCRVNQGDQVVLEDLVALVDLVVLVALVALVVLVVLENLVNQVALQYLERNHKVSRILENTIKEIAARCSAINFEIFCFYYLRDSFISISLNVKSLCFLFMVD